MRSNPVSPVSTTPASLRGWRRTLVVLLLLLPLLPTALHAQTTLQPGDRVVFYGDSITQQRLYTRYLQQYLLCRYPELKLVFFNAGWSGDTARGGLNRLERDVLPLKPNVVTLFFGMNDGGYRALNDGTVKSYRDSMDKLITALKDKGIRVIVFTPGCVDPDRRKTLADCNYNQMLEALGTQALELARQHDCVGIDVFHPMLALQQKMKEQDPKFTMIPDAVHPSNTGHQVMASVMLKGFAAEPMPPIGVVDLAGGSAEGVKIVTNRPEQVTLETSRPVLLPYWHESGVADVMKASGFGDFVSPRLTVKGLPAGAWQVQTAGGVDAPAVSAADLTQGVGLDLGGVARAKALHDWIARKENNYFTAWREIGLSGIESEGVKEVVQHLMAADAAMAKVALDLAQPVGNQKITLSLLPDGANLAKGKSYVVSDPNAHNWGIGGLTDGNWGDTSKTCFATNSGMTFPKTATIDLEAPARVNAVVLGVPKFGSTRTIVVAVSSDGQSFQDVGSHEFAQGAMQKHTYRFAPVEARYIRLTYPDYHEKQAGYPVGFMFTLEAEVYGEAK